MKNVKYLSIKEIKQKKEFSDLPDFIILEYLESYLKKYNIDLESLNIKGIKTIIKDIRAVLRLHVGRFQKSLKNKPLLLDQNKTLELLKTHTSTAERLSFYPKLKDLIKSLKISSILDLGCGLNPIALASPGTKYYASDIKQSDLLLIDKFFKKNKIKGKTFIHDIKKTNENLPSADICLLLKILDIIEKNPSQLSEKIISQVKCNYILISFSTITLSGKLMKMPRRFWLEKILKKLKYKYEIFSSNNEIFYLVKK